MKGPNIVLAASGVVVVVALGLAWQSLYSARAAEAALARILAQRVQVDAEVRNAEKRLAEAKRLRRGLTATTGGLKQAPPSRPRGSGPSADLLLRNSPKLQTLYFDSLRERQRNNFASFCHALGLSPEQIGKLEDLYLQAAERTMDLRWAAQSQGSSTTDSAFLGLQRQIADQLAADTRSLLGDAGYQQLQDLQRTAPVSYMVGELGATVAATATPLSAEQGTQLTRILANASSGYQSGKMATLATIDWDAAIGQAQGILSAPQMAALQTAIASQQDSQALTQLARLAAQAARGK